MPSTTLSPPTTRGSDYAALSHLIARAGLLRRRPGYYLVRIGLVTCLYIGGWVTFAVVGDSWYQLIVASFMAVVFTQLALVAHDIAHRQVFRTRRPSQIAGLLAGNLGIGMSYGWWMDKHSRHHANPNHEERDPDVLPDVLIWSTRQARASAGIPRLLGRCQAYLFFPLTTLQGVSLKVSSVRALTGPAVRHRRVEAVLLFLHIAAYLTAVLLVLSPAKAVAFLAVHMGLFGVYLGCTFAPNHKGMQTLTNDDEPLDFLRRQVLTSRNVRGGHFITMLLGGLNYQIEHHLFPNMPTPNLRHARLIVRDYCARIGVPYAEANLAGSYRQALRHLHDAGAPIRNRRDT